MQNILHVFKGFATLQEAMGIFFFRDILKCLRRTFSAATVKKYSGFFDDKTQTILVKHAFSPSHLRALPILLLKVMTNHNSHLKFAFYSRGTWKRLNSKYKLSGLTRFMLKQLTLSNQQQHLLCFCFKE